MGFLDKVKEQAAVAGAAAKDAAAKGKDKLEDVQAKRSADAILRDLGVAFYAQQTGRPGPTQADIERLVAALRSHEEMHGLLPLVLESPAGAPPGAPPPPPPTGQPAQPTTPPPAGQAPPPPPSGSTL